jgi:hypothetical protein
LHFFPTCLYLNPPHPAHTNATARFCIVFVQPEPTNTAPCSFNFCFVFQQRLIFTMLVAPTSVEPITVVVHQSAVHRLDLFTRVVLVAP